MVQNVVIYCRQVAILVVAIFVVLLTSSAARAEPYGGGGYGACSYGQVCTPVPTSTPSSTPSPAPGGAIAGYSLNLTDGQIITTPTYVIRAKLSKPSDTSLVDRVEYYVDDLFIGTATTPDAGGIYEFLWQLGSGSSSRVKVIMFDKSGNQIPQEVTVRRGSPGASQAPSPATTSPGPTGFIERAVRAVQNATQSIATVVQKAAEGAAKTVENIVKHTPPAVAVSFPYFLFLLLLILALILLYRTQQEIRQIKALSQALEQDRALADEKTVFIQLSSHYLRTPLTLIKNGVSLLSDLGKITPTLAQTLSRQSDELGQKIELIIDKISSDTTLQAIQAPERAALLRSWLSPGFILPIALVGLLAFTANVLFINVGGIDVGVINLLAQLIIFASLATMLYSVLRARNTQILNRRHAAAIMEHQVAIDRARNVLIRDTIALCTDTIRQLRQSLPQLHGVKHAEIVEQGFTQLDSLVDKFSFVVRLESGQSQIQMTQFPLGEVMSRIQARYQTQLTAKQLQFVVPVSLLNVFQNAELLEEVIGSLVDNAIKFSSPGGRIEVLYEPGGQGLSLSVADQGSGIPPDKLPHLFKPFTRAESALTFDHPGLGLSLYLDKLIMLYLGGNIQVQTVPSKGAVIQLDFPIVPRSAPKLAPTSAPPQPALT